jgi:hypothetical protein
MSWNNRVVKRTYPVGEELHYTYSIHECYYDVNGKIWAFSSEPDAIVGDTIEDVSSGLDLMSKALEAPVLNYEELPEVGAVGPDGSEVFRPQIVEVTSKKGGCSKC